VCVESDPRLSPDPQPGGHWRAVGAAVRHFLAGQRDLRLIDAIQRRDEKAFTTLLRSKADVNAAQPDGATALAWAVHLRERSMAEALVAAGANVNSVDEYGESPLTLAAANGDADLVSRLLAAGAKAGSTRWNGETALMIAAGAGSVSAVRSSCCGADVNAADPGADRRRSCGPLPKGTRMSSRH
jgi:ankyrin repeat protein